ncbi:unnamed protein product [Calypogeia fissa]
MVWKRGGESVREEGSGLAIAPTRMTETKPLAAPVVPLDFEVRESVCPAPPGCLSFIALPLPTRSSSSASSSQCPFTFCVDLFRAAALPLPLMDSLVPSPFSRSSLSSYFPSHLAIQNSTVSSPSPSPSPSPKSVFNASASFSVSSPSGTRWRRKEPEVNVPPSESVVSLSSRASLASLASSLPPFSPAEKAFVVSEAKEEDLKASRRGGNSEHDAGDGLPFIRNFMAGNAKFRKEAASFLKQLRSELCAIPVRNYGTAAKRKDTGTLKVALGGNGSSENRAESISEGQQKAIQTSKHLLAGAIAAMVSRTIVAPLERLKLEYLVRGAKANVVQTLQTIFLTEGVLGFWKGNGVNIIRTAPFKSINFVAYDTFRRQLLRWGDRAEVTNIERLAAGAAAGVTATILCFPLDTIRTLMVAPGGDAMGGLVGCFRHLIRTEGVSGLYKGLPAAVVSMAPSGAVFYGVYDILKSAYLNSPEGKEMLKARQKRAEERPDENSTQLELGTMRTLLFGAIAGACSETVTYPLEVVRRAQQMQCAGNKLGMIATIEALMRKGGFAALYAGIIPSTLQCLPSAALSYFVYETVKIAFKIP